MQGFRKFTMHCEIRRLYATKFSIFEGAPLHFYRDFYFHHILTWDLPIFFGQFFPVISESPKTYAIVCILSWDFDILSPSSIVYLNVWVPSNDLGRVSVESAILLRNLPVASYSYIRVSQRLYRVHISSSGTQDKQFDRPSFLSDGVVYNDSSMRTEIGSII